MKYHLVLHRDSVSDLLLRMEVEKSTLLNILAGKEGHDEGNITFRRDLRVGYLEQSPSYPEELTVLEACFHHGNSTVELIKRIRKRCMETPGNPGLEDLLARMEHEKAWDYERRAKQILSQLKIRHFDQKMQTSFRRAAETCSFGKCADK